MNEHTQSGIYDLAQTPSGEIIIEENAPGGVVLARFYRPGVGNLPIKKNCPGFAQGRWSGLELTDTQKKLTTNMRTICGMINFAMSP